jgi:hypothetical protein
VHQLAATFDNEEPRPATLRRLLLELQQELDFRVLLTGNNFYHVAKLQRFSGIHS